MGIRASFIAISTYFTDLTLVSRAFYVLTGLNILSLFIFAELVDHGQNVLTVLSQSATAFSSSVIFGSLGLMSTWFLRKRANIYFLLFCSLMFLCFPMLMLATFSKPVPELLLLSLTINYMLWCWFITCQIITTFPLTFEKAQK